MPRSMAAMVAAVVAGLVLTAAAWAQEERGVLDACALGKAEIVASELPGTVDQDRCPVAGRSIVDNGVGAAVPAPGESVAAFASGPRGGQELLITNPPGEDLIVEGAGDETAQDRGTARLASRASGTGCGDRFYDDWNMKVYGYNRWYVKTGSIPSYLSRPGTVSAIRTGGGNVTGVDGPCGVRDRVDGRLIYEGATKRSADIGAGGNCKPSDGRSVVDFGDLPGSNTGVACVYSRAQDGRDRVAGADIRLNKAEYRWANRIGGSCRNRYDVQSTITHERGHHFGLGEANPGRHPNLTMRGSTGGPCRTYKRSLGKGDALGLVRKY